jgi:hypothetical protein
MAFPEEKRGFVSWTRPGSEQAQRWPLSSWGADIDRLGRCSSIDFSIQVPMSECPDEFYNYRSGLVLQELRLTELSKDVPGEIILSRVFVVSVTAMDSCESSWLMIDFKAPLADSHPRQALYDAATSR